MNTSKWFTVLLGLATITTMAQTSNTDVSHYKEGVGIISDAEMESIDSTLFSFSARIGYYNEKDSDFVDKSWGSQLELRAALGDTPLDIVLRGHYASVDYDDTELIETAAYPYLNAKVYSAGITEFYNTKKATYGGSIQLQWNFCKTELLNPYISAGIVYDKYEFETDLRYAQRNLMTYKWLSSTWANSGYGRIEEDDDGTAFVGRVGIEFYPDPFYARLEAAYLTELYEDDAQAELSAVVGAKVTDNFRIDLSGTYFTEWKEYYICAGFSILL